MIATDVVWPDCSQPGSRPRQKTGRGWLPCPGSLRIIYGTLASRPCPVRAAIKASGEPIPGNQMRVRQPVQRSGYEASPAMKFGTIMAFVAAALGTTELRVFSREPRPAKGDERL